MHSVGSDPCYNEDMSVSASLPASVSLVRTTPEFTAETIPAGLCRAHRIAAGVWGVLRVLEGDVTFVLEAKLDQRFLAAGESQVIEPGVAHHVELSDAARFVIEFYR